MTIARTKIENENSNWSGVDRVDVGAEERARHAAERGAGRVGQQLGACTSGTPMLPAATSSSRSAIQARPSRESRRRKFTNSTNTTRPSATQYQGLRFEPG